MNISRRKLLASIPVAPIAVVGAAGAVAAVPLPLPISKGPYYPGSYGPINFVSDFGKIEIGTIRWEPISEPVTINRTASEIEAKLAMYKERIAKLMAMQPKSLIPKENPNG